MCATPTVSAAKTHNPARWRRNSLAFRFDTPACVRAVSASVFDKPLCARAAFASVFVTPLRARADFAFASSAWLRPSR